MRLKLEKDIFKRQYRNGGRDRTRQLPCSMQEVREGGGQAPSKDGLGSQPLEPGRMVPLTLTRTPGGSVGFKGDDYSSLPIHSFTCCGFSYLWSVVIQRY